MKTLINFYAAVSEATVNTLINFITQQIAMGAKNKTSQLEELIIQISSSGGSSDHGLLAYNYLSQLDVKKTTIGMGNVDSAAVMIFSAGDQRLAMPSCRFVLHEAISNLQGSFNGTKLHEIANLNDTITKDYCRVIAKTTANKLNTVEKKVRKGQVMSAEDAKKDNLVTKIQDSPYIQNLEKLNIFMINNPQNQTALPRKNNNANVKN